MDDNTILQQDQIGLLINTSPEIQDKTEVFEKPSFKTLSALWLQRTIGLIFVLPFGGFLASLLKYLRGYEIENVKEVRKTFRELTKDKFPLLICANHLTFVDSALMIWAFAPLSWYQFHFRAFSWNLPAGDFFKKKLVYRIIAYLSKCIFIHRDGSKDHKNSILGACHYLLKRGEIVSIFPEGRRSRTGKFDADRITFGAGKVLAATPGCRILCVYLRSHKQATFSGYPPKGSRFHFLMKCITPETNQVGRAAYQELMGSVAETMKGLEAEYIQKFGPLPVAQKKTALVSGASSGIGRALALHMAEAGNNLVITARDTGRLNEIADICRQKFGSQVLVVAKDLATPGAAREIFLETQKHGIQVDTLVNNAGFGVHGNFESTDLAQEISLVHTQITATLELTKHFLPAMIAKKSGQILNVGSVYAYCPVPGQSVYSASKAFLNSFGDSLSSELSPHGITVTTVHPGITRTAFRSRMGRPDKNSGMAPEKVAAFAYKAMNQGKRTAVPGGLNKAFVFICNELPPRGKAWLISIINGRRGLST